MSAHTPGPWRAQLSMSATAFLVKDATGVQVCSMSWHSSNREHYTLRDESRANATLIAAAPDLLAELQRVYDALGGECFDWGPVRAAIAKAGGQA